MPRRSQMLVVWRVVKRTRQLLLKLPLLLTIHSPRGRAEEREEVRDEIANTAFGSPVLLLWFKVVQGTGHPNTVYHLIKYCYLPVMSRFGKDLNQSGEGFTSAAFKCYLV